jgi:hypothetical protein
VPHSIRGFLWQSIAKLVREQDDLAAMVGLV